MDPITQRQQTESAKRLLRAYSAEYRRAKKCRKIRAAGAIAFAIAGPVSAVWSITTAAYIAAAAGAWTVIVRVLLKRYENEAQHHAVAIHELFDTEVLGLPWSESLAGRKPADEDILKAARTVADDAKLTARIDAVQADQVQAMAQRLFDPELIAVTLLGRLDGIKLSRNQLVC